ncbi:hypothetical protein DL768_003312 [Monosporascus sp. mg162]|nr:hypothetical protein DL768_003312 [Monosporascus sp. mg162]
MNNECDQKLPGCNGCEKAGVACAGYDFLTGQDIPRCYILFLEARAQQLEYLFYKNGTKYLSTEDVLQLFKPASYQYDSNSNTLASNIPGDIQVKEDPEQEPCAAALSYTEKGILNEHSSKGDASNTERVKAPTDGISNIAPEKQAGANSDHQGKPNRKIEQRTGSQNTLPQVAHAGVQTNMQNTASNQSSRVTQDSQVSVSNFEKYQVLPTLSDQQNKKRLLDQVKQAQRLSQNTSRPNGGGNDALQGYQMQVMLPEQQNKKRRQLARQAEEARQFSQSTSRPNWLRGDALRDYQMQNEMLEQQNKKRLQLARQAEEAQRSSECTIDPENTGSYVLELYQTQSTVPETQSQNHLGMAHQEQEQASMTSNDAMPVGEEKSGRGEPRVSEASAETDRKACSNISTQGTRPHASPSRSVESLTGISGAGVSEASNKSGATEAADIEPGPRAGSKSILCHFKPQIRQVGRAKVRLEILALSDDFQTGHESTDDSDDDPDESDDHLEAHDDEKDSDTTDTTHTTAPSQNRPENAPPHSGTGSETPRDGGMKRKQEEEEGDDNGGKKRKRQKASGSEEMAGTLRLACPYQAYERFRPCFKRSRQHLSRNHMPSYRCQNCWAYLNTKDKATDHEKQTSCSKKPRPQEEVFMTEEQENAIRGVCQSQTDEDAWWRLFRLLIPGMRDLDMIILTANYTPCQCLQVIRAEPQTQNVRNRQQITPQETFAFSPPTSSLQDAPVLEFMGGPIQDPDSGFFGLPLSAGVDQLSSNVDSRRSSNPFVVPLSSASTTTSTLLTSDATTFDRNRMQQNYRRLRTRFQQTVEANQRLTMGIDQIYLLVEDIMASGEIPGPAYDKLVEVAETISRMKGAAP